MLKAFKGSLKGLQGLVRTLIALTRHLRGPGSLWETPGLGRLFMQFQGLQGKARIRKKRAKRSCKSLG